MSDLTREFLSQVDKLYEKDNRGPDTRSPLERPNRVSEIGWVRSCKRHLVLNRLYPEKRIVAPALRMRFAEGYIHEAAMREELMKAGHTIVPVNHVVTIPELNLRGEIDDLIEFKKNRVVLDYKSASGFTFKQIKKCEDGLELRNLPFPWIVRDVDQIMAYSYILKQPFGWLYFKNKESAEKSITTVRTVKADVDFLFEGLREVNALVEKRDVGPAPDDYDVCAGCDYAATYCWPNGIPSQASTKEKQAPNPELVAVLRNQEWLKAKQAPELSKEWEENQERIKDIMSGVGEGTWTVGKEFTVIAKPRKAVWYDWAAVTTPEQKEAAKRETPWLSLKIVYRGGL